MPSGTIRNTDHKTQERRRVEEQYSAALKKLAARQLSEEAADLGCVAICYPYAVWRHLLTERQRLLNAMAEDYRFRPSSRRIASRFGHQHRSRRRTASPRICEHEPGDESGAHNERQPDDGRERS